MQERRIHRRFKVNDDFTRLDAMLTEYAVDVSKGGVFIRSRQSVPVGSRVEVRFSILLDDFLLIDGEGEVVRVVTDGPMPGMGIRFTRLSENARRNLDLLAQRAG